MRAPNRHQRRAAEAKARRHADIIETSLAALAAAGDTATGATVFMPDGSVHYFDAATARAWAARQAEGQRDPH